MREIKIAVTVALGFLYALLATSCSFGQPKKTEGSVILVTKYLDQNDDIFIIDTIKVWHYDSTAIHEMHIIKIVTDTNNLTSITYKNTGYRFILLRNNTWFDVLNLSDTGKIYNQGVLPEKIFKDGWAFYSRTARLINGVPTFLGDTSIGNISYQQYRFNLMEDNPKEVYRIGLLNCKIKDKLFSLEKSLPDSTGCTMTKLYTYVHGKKIPSVSFELEYLSDTIPTTIKQAILRYHSNNLVPTFKK